MKVDSRNLCLGLFAATVIAAVGCAGTQMPRLESPGSAGSQRYSALQWDPYPLDDIAPPVTGGRPQEYARPIPEVKRGQTFVQRRPQAPVLAPSFAAPVSPVITAPPALPAAPAVSPFAPPPTTPYQQNFAPMPAAAPAAVPVYPGM